MRILAAVAVVSLLFVPEAPIAQGRQVPTPESVFGFEPGADYKLATYDQSIDYFRKLAAASKHVRLVEAGQDDAGAADVLRAHLERRRTWRRSIGYREIAQRLAHPAGLTDAEARALAREGKAFVHIDGGLHSTEVAGAQHTPLLAYDLVSRASEPDDQGDARQRHPDAVADDQPRRPADGGRVVHEERRHAVRAVRPAAALPGVRRATTTTATPTCST